MARRRANAAVGRGFLHHSGRGIPRRETRLFHPSRRVRRGLPLVRRQVYVEPETLSADRCADRDRPCDVVSGAGHRHHGRRAAALSAGRAHGDAAREGVADFSGNIGLAPFQRCFRLGVSLAEAPAAAPGRGVRTGRRTESDRRVGGGFRMGRAECRPRRRKVPAVPPARVERCRKGHARNSRVRQGASAMSIRAAARYSTLRSMSTTT